MYIKISITTQWKVTNMGVSSLSIGKKIVTLQRLLTNGDHYVSLKNV